MDTSYLKLFKRFLKFGCLAWGGPVAQIAMIRQELVEDEKWISREQFNRALGVYQVLPGPEAHELCVYFGMLAKGRLGGFLAGLGFMLPGFILMFALSWFYVSYGIASPLFVGMFYGMQAVVPALIIKAIHRISDHSLTNRWLLALAIIAGITQLLGIHFGIILIFCGLSYFFIEQQKQIFLILTGVLFSIIVAAQVFFPQVLLPTDTTHTLLSPPSFMTLFYSGLRSGLLTFGGAYTVISFLQHDAVEIGRWMTNSQFLDGLALSGILPAPLIIFSTFVGYVGGGPLGSLLLTLGIFAPAFGFTLIGHNAIEKLIQKKSLHAFLDGVTAGVVGLIGATTLQMLKTSMTDWKVILLCATALMILYQWKSKMSVVGVVLIAGIVGILLKLT